jgi:hypothetical protein
MHTQNKIGWQKYESLLHDQLNSPLLDSIYYKFANAATDVEPLHEGEEELDSQLMIPIDERLIENISLANNFECWMGHTNFNITEEIKNILNETEGVEILKICSRYRFFVGIGKMFNFSDVRRRIQNNLGKIEGESLES